MTSAQLLAMQRTAAGLTRRQLALRVGVRPHMIAAYEEGTRRPLQPVLRRLATALGLGFDAFRESADAAATPRPTKPRQAATEPGRV